MTDTTNSGRLSVEEHAALLNRSTPPSLQSELWERLIMHGSDANEVREFEGLEKRPDDPNQSIWIEAEGPSYVFHAHWGPRIEIPSTWGRDINGNPIKYKPPTTRNRVKWRVLGWWLDLREWIDTMRYNLSDWIRP